MKHSKTYQTGKKLRHLEVFFNTLKQELKTEKKKKKVMKVTMSRSRTPPKVNNA